MRFVLIPDSFKGTMSSADICAIMRERILRFFPAAEVVSIPVADGGEGSVDAFLAAAGGEKIFAPAKGPYMEDMEGFYGALAADAAGEKTAVVEMAACAGLPLAGDKLHPEKTTTYGVGLLIAHAARHGCRKIIAALGGSATNDFGAGAAAACGVKFFDAAGKEFIPVGGTLADIARIDTSGLIPELRNAEITAMCDIDNPLYGENGAAYVFAPQKGADRAMVETLDGQLRAVCETVKRELGVDVSALPGAGAAGGMGGGMVAFFGAKLRMGIETVLDAVNFDEVVSGADIVFSGEGKIDSQSLRGKVVIGVARRARKHNVPVIAMVGDIADDIAAAYDEGVSAIFSINRVALPYRELKGRARSDMALCMDDVLRLLSIAGR